MESGRDELEMAMMRALLRRIARQIVEAGACTAAEAEELQRRVETAGTRADLDRVRGELLERCAPRRAGEHSSS